MAEYSWLCEDIETLMTYTKDGYTKAVLNQAVNAIRKLSTDAQPVRHGRWRLGGYGQISDATTRWYDQFLQGGFLYCSACRKRSNRKTPYCPNCGAKMDIKEECP